MIPDEKLDLRFKGTNGWLFLWHRRKGEVGRPQRPAMSAPRQRAEGVCWEGVGMKGSGFKNSGECSKIREFTRKTP